MNDFKITCLVDLIIRLSISFFIDVYLFKMDKYILCDIERREVTLHIPLFSLTAHSILLNRLFFYLYHFVC